MAQARTIRPQRSFNEDNLPRQSVSEPDPCLLHYSQQSFGSSHQLNSFDLQMAESILVCDALIVRLLWTNIIEARSVPLRQLHAVPVLGIATLTVARQQAVSRHVQHPKLEQHDLSVGSELDLPYHLRLAARHATS
jgi:hypothetical protein